MAQALLGRFRKTVDSLGFRLGLAVGVSVMFACLLVTAGVLLRTAEQQNAARTTEMQTYANVLAAGIANAMADGTISDVTRTLNAIATASGIEFAAAYDMAGRRIAGIGMQAVLIDRGPENAFEALFSAKTATVEAPIRKGGQQIGVLRLAGELPNTGAAFRAELRNAALWAGLALLIGMVIGHAFQRQIVRPLQRLTGTIRAGRSRRRLPKRVPVTGKGEIRVLTGAYNHMISEITSRELELNNYRLHLEELVDVRTSELRVARDEAEAATEAKSRFLATMSHEIRTPMNGLLVMAELLERSNLPPSEARHAGTIARSGRSLMHLLNEIMDFSKLEAGKIELEAIPVSPDEIVGDCMGLFWEQARAKEIEIVSTIAPDVPARLIGDPTRIGQCLSNLVGNAIKFTDTGHVAIDVSLDAEGTLVVAVSDTGLGIPEDRLSSIFEAFSQADQSTTRRHGGTGLGLNICIQLAEAMGGTIDVQSTLGAGSCFTLRLPLDAEEGGMSAGALPACVAVETAYPALGAALEQALAARGIATQGTPDARFVDAGQVTAASDIPAIGLWRLDADLPGQAVGQGWLDDLLRVPVQRGDLDAVLERIATQKLRGLDWLREQSAAGDTARGQDLSGLRVLLADDSAVNREVMGEALSLYDIVPTIACDGAEAIARLREMPFDIAFVDGEMPHLDGFEVARRARAEEIATRLVLFSAHAGKTLAHNAVESGFDATLPKPFPLDTLQKMLLEVADVDPDTAGTATPQPDAQNAPEDDAVLDPATLASLRALEDRRPGAMQRVLDRFTENLPDAVSRLTSVLNGADREEMRKAAHALKSMCLSIGSARMSATTAMIERAAAGEAAFPAEWEARPEILINQLDNEKTELLNAVESLKFETSNNNYTVSI